MSATIRDVMTAHRATSPFLARHGTFSVTDREQSAAPHCHWPPAARQPCEVGQDPELPDRAGERLDRLLLGEGEGARRSCGGPPSCPTEPGRGWTDCC